MDKLLALGVAVVLLAVGSASKAQLITFDGLTPGTFQNSYTEGLYTVSSIDGSIFVGGSSVFVPTGPVIFASNPDTRFRLTGPQFDLRSIDLGPVNDSVGPQAITFTGTLVDGGTVSQMFATGSTFALQTFTFDPSFSDLTSVEWQPLLSMTDNILLWQRDTMTFDGLVPGSNQTAYSENGYRLSSTGGSIFVGGSFGAVLTGPVIFASNADTLFTFAVEDGRPFDVFSIQLGPINDTVGAQEVTFTGTLAGGGTVSTTFTTGSVFALDTFTFGPEFSNLSSLHWMPGVTITDNIHALVVPEPVGLALAALAALGLMRRHRRHHHLADAAAGAGAAAIPRARPAGGPAARAAVME